MNEKRPPQAGLTSIEEREPPELETLILDDITQKMLETMFPMEIVDGGLSDDEGDPSGTKYGAAMHASLVRFKILGLADPGVAKAAGIIPQTLANWRKKYPKLDIDLSQALELSKAHTIVLLRQLMKKGDHTAFQAIKLWLERVATEFRPRADIAVATIDTNAIRSIRRELYGLDGEDQEDESKFIEQESFSDEYLASPGESREAQPECTIPLLPVAEGLPAGHFETESTTQNETGRGDIRGNA